MERSTILLLLLIFLCHSQISNAAFSSWKNPNECGNMTIFSINEFKEVRRPILDRLWRKSLVGCESRLAKSFKNQIRALLDSGDDDIFGYAERCVIMLSILSPHMEDNPITCYTAQLIDASIPCIADKECSGIIDSLAGSGCLSVEHFYTHLFNYMYYNGVGRVDDCLCDDDDIYSQYPEVKCEENGLVYKIDEIWNAKGDYLPRELKCTVRKLYDSCDDGDRFIANMATYRLLELSTLFKNGLDPKMVYEFLYLQYAPMNRHCCCGPRKDRLRDLRAALLADGNNNVQYLTSFHENRV